MKYCSHSTAWVFSDLKSAALYFEKVHIFEDCLLGGLNELEELRTVARESHPADFPGFTIMAPRIFLLGKTIVSMQAAGVEKLFEVNGKSSPFAVIPADTVEGQLARTLLTVRLAVDTGISGPGSLVIPTTKVVQDPTADPSAFLTGIKVIDPSKLSWEQILEIRKDEESLQKLGNLRRFLCQEYEGADRDFMHDDLQHRIQQYEETAKKCGADMREGGLSMLIGDDIKISMAAALAAAALGQPMVALAAAAPALCRFGQVVLEIRRQRREFSADLGYNPVAFLGEASQQVKNSPR